MKRCPTCNRTFVDDTQKFCLDDGSTLLDETPSSFDPQATLALGAATPTSPPSNPYGSGAGQTPPSGSGQGYQGSAQGYSGSGAGQSGYGAGSGQGSYGAASGQNQQAGPWAPTPQRFTPVSTAAPKKSMLPWVLGGAAVVVIGIIGIILVVAITYSGSSNKNSNSNSNSSSGRSNSNKSKPSTIVIRSSDGKIQVSVPPTWKSTSELNDKAELQVSDSGNEMYLIVLSDIKADYADMDIDRHSVATLEALTKAMTYSNKVGPTKLTINGNPAIQYEIRGEIKNVNVIYLHTTVETSTHYHQIVAWTLQSKYSEREETLKDAINSFTEN